MVGEGCETDEIQVDSGTLSRGLIGQSGAVQGPEAVRSWGHIAPAAMRAGYRRGTPTLRTL